MVKGNRAPKRRQVYQERDSDSDSDDDVVEDMPKPRPSKRKKVVVPSHGVKMSPMNTTQLPIEILVMIMGHLHPQDMFHMALLCKALRNALSYDCVIRNSILAYSERQKNDPDIPNHAYCMNLLMEAFFSRKSIHIPSPIRLLRLMNGKTCEMPGCSNDEVCRYVSLLYGLFACHECLQAWSNDCSRGRYGKLLRPNHLFPCTVRQKHESRIMAWRAPYYDASGVVVGPMMTMQHADRIIRGETTLNECVQASNMMDVNAAATVAAAANDVDDADASTNSSNITSLLLSLKTPFDKAVEDGYAYGRRRNEIAKAAEANRQTLKQEQLNKYLRLRLKGGVWDDVATRIGMCQVGFVLARFKEADSRSRSHQLSRGTLDKIVSDLQPNLDLVANMDLVDVSTFRRSHAKLVDPTDAYLIDHWTARQNDPKSFLEMNFEFVNIADSGLHNNQYQRAMESLWYRFQGLFDDFPEFVTMIKTLNPALSSVDAKEIAAQWKTCRKSESKEARRDYICGRCCNQRHPWLVYRKVYARTVQALKASLPCPPSVTSSHDPA